MGGSVPGMAKTLWTKGISRMKPPFFKLVVIRSTDINGTMAFYRSLGIEFKEDQHGSGPRHFAADLGGIVFEIYPTKKPEDVNRTTRLGFSLQKKQPINVKIRFTLLSGDVRTCQNKTEAFRRVKTGSLLHQ